MPPPMNIVTVKKPMKAFLPSRSLRESEYAQGSVIARLTTTLAAV